MSNSMVDLSVIIVNWNSIQFLEKCVKSIYRETKRISFEIIVIDNASFDKSDKMLLDLYPQVTFIQLDTNTGFAHANNVAAANSHGKVLCFLNPDTEIRDHALEQALLLIVNNSTIGALGCRLLNSDLSLQTSCIMPFPTIINQMFDIEWLKMKTPHLKLWGIAPLFDTCENIVLDVEAISGACMLISKNVFLKVMGFTEDYFMYSEDVDLCYKIKQAGYRVVYDNRDEIVHHGGGSTKDKTPGKFSTIMMRESLFKYFAKNKSMVYADIYKRATFVIGIIRIGLLLFTSLVLMISGKKKPLDAALQKWVWVVGWSLGKKFGV